MKIAIHIDNKRKEFSIPEKEIQYFEKGSRLKFTKNRFGVIESIIIINNVGSVERVIPILEDTP